MPPTGGTASESGEPTRISPDTQSTTPGRAVAPETLEDEASSPQSYATHEHAPPGPETIITASPSKPSRGLQNRGTCREKKEPTVSRPRGRELPPLPKAVVDRPRPQTHRSSLDPAGPSGSVKPPQRHTSSMVVRPGLDGPVKSAAPLQQAGRECRGSLSSYSPRSAE